MSVRPNGNGTIRRTNSFMDYEWLELLGAGSFGETWLARDRITNLQLAVKRIKINSALMTPEIMESLARETSVLEGLSQPTTDWRQSLVAHYYTSFHTREADKDYFVIVMEYIDGVTLAKFMKDQKPKGPLEPERIWNIMWGLVNGLHYIHDMGFAHEDIKPANIMINPLTLQIKYIDFGLSCIRRSNICKNHGGTPSYFSPELLVHPRLRNSWTAQTARDVWSLGLVLYKLVNQRPAYPALKYVTMSNTWPREFYNIFKGPRDVSSYSIEGEKIYSATINELIEHMLAFKVNQRAKIDVIADYMIHENEGCEINGVILHRPQMIKYLREHRLYVNDLDYQRLDFICSRFKDAVARYGMEGLPSAEMSIDYTLAMEIEDLIELDEEDERELDEYIRSHPLEPMDISHTMVMESDDDE